MIIWEQVAGLLGGAFIVGYATHPPLTRAVFYFFAASIAGYFFRPIFSEMVTFMKGQPLATQYFMTSVFMGICLVPTAKKIQQGITNIDNDWGDRVIDKLLKRSDGKDKVQK